MRWTGQRSWSPPWPADGQRIGRARNSDRLRAVNDSSLPEAPAPRHSPGGSRTIVPGCLTPLSDVVPSRPGHGDARRVQARADHRGSGEASHHEDAERRIFAHAPACTRAASAAPNSRLWSPADGGSASSTSTSAQPSRILPGAAVHLGSVSHLEFVPVEIVCGRHMSACVQCISRLDLLVEDNQRLVICSFSLRLSQGIASLCEDAISPLLARATFSATRRRVCRSFAGDG